MCRLAAVMSDNEGKRKRKLKKMDGKTDKQATIKRGGMYSLNVEHKVY
jgi:hypothetical protein